MDRLLHEIRRARRTLAARPLFTVVASSTLALAIGANTVVFSAIDAVLLRDLPFPRPDRLVMVWETVPARGQDEAFLAFPNFRDYRDGTSSFEGMAAFFANPNQDVNLTGGVVPERVNVARVTAGYFDVLGVEPALGRGFTEDEDVVGNHRVAILSHGLWTRQFGGDRDMVGGTVQVNGFPYTVVGVMPADFRPVGSLALGEEVEMWRPLAASDQQREARWWRNLRVVGRLREGVPVETAEREVAAVSDRIAEEDPENQAGRGVRLVTLREQTVGGVRGSLSLMWGAVVLVLLIACANVANLLLVEAGRRAREMSVRASLGASRGRIVGQLFVESGLLASLGAAGGMLLAWIGIAGLRRLAGGHAPLIDRAVLDGRVLLFDVAVTAATSVLFGLVPAVHAARPDLTRALKESSAGGGRSGWGATRVFIVAQLALAVVLMVGSGLLIRSFATLRSVEPGFRPEGLLTLQLELPMVTKYPSQEERGAFFRELRTRLGALPGVESVGNALAVPMGERGQSSTFWITGRPEPDSDDRPAADVHAVSPEYLGTMGIPVLRGRGIEAEDSGDAPTVLLVSKALADRLFPGDEPVGAEVEVDGMRRGRVVGVVGDVRTHGLASPPRPAIYYAADQIAYNFMTVVLRTRGEPRALLPAVRAQLRTMDPELPLHNVRTVEELLGRDTGREAFTARLLTAFALLALLIAAVGTYGVMATAVARRRREIGIRLALGAEPSDAFRMITAEGALLVGSGLGLGLIVAVALSGTVRSMLFEVGAVDPWAYVGTAGVLAAAGLGTVALVAARAARTDPVEPLRTE